MVMGWMAKEWGFDSWQEKGIFLFSTASRLVLGHTHSPVQWGLWE
jgi:hypothetical protein